MAYNVSYSFLSNQPRSNSYTMITTLTAINGILMTVCTDEMRFITLDFADVSGWPNAGTAVSPWSPTKWATLV